MPAQSAPMGQGPGRVSRLELQDFKCEKYRSRLPSVVVLPPWGDAVPPLTKFDHPASLFPRLQDVQGTSHSWTVHELHRNHRPQRRACGATTAPASHLNHALVSEAPA